MTPSRSPVPPSGEPTDEIVRLRAENERMRTAAATVLGRVQEFGRPEIVHEAFGWRGTHMCTDAGEALNSLRVAAGLVVEKTTRSPYGIIVRRADPTSPAPVSEPTGCKHCREGWPKDEHGHHRQRTAQHNFDLGPCTAAAVSLDGTRASAFETLLDHYGVDERCYAREEDSGDHAIIREYDDDRKLSRAKVLAYVAGLLSDARRLEEENAKLKAELAAAFTKIAQTGAIWHRRADDPHCGADEAAGFGPYHAEMMSDETMYLQLGPDIFTVYFDKQKPCLHDGRKHRKGVLQLRLDVSADRASQSAASTERSVCVTRETLPPHDTFSDAAATETE